jgi:predicted ATP-dependent endonuclease of OLD family
MFLSRIRIKNFRSIEDLDLTFQKGRNVLVGKNNSGKSNIIKALDLVLGESAPGYMRSENVTVKDFFSSKDPEGVSQVASELIIICFLQREVGENLNYEEINKCYGYYKYKNLIPPDLFENTPEKIYDINPEELASGYDGLKVYVNPKLRNQLGFSNEINDKNEFAIALKVCRKEEEIISKDLRLLYRKDKNNGWTLSFSGSIRNELLQSAIIPSFRDPQNQLRLTDYNWYGKLMKSLTKDSPHIDKLKDAFAKVKEVSDQIFKEATTEISQNSINGIFPNSELTFQFNNDLKVDLYKNTNIFIDDGVKTLLTDKGSGIQSAAIIGLFSYYTKEVNTKSSALLALEEPEIYLHPHGRRVINEKLEDFLANGKNQIILTTHSSEFITTFGKPSNIVLVTKSLNNGTEAKSIDLTEFKDLFFDQDMNELFFADKVIVCEGFDKYFLSWIDQNCSQQFNKQNTSVVSAGGKDNIIKIIKLIGILGLNCFLLADFDFLLRDKSEEADKFKSDDGQSNRHENILNIGDQFFKQPSIFAEDFQKWKLDIEKIRCTIKKDDEALFYKAKSSDEFKNKAYYEELLDLLKNLRSSGIGILNKDLEDYILDKTVLSDRGKIDYESIFKINNLLCNGKTIDEIIDTTDIKELVDKVNSDN